MHPVVSLLFFSALVFDVGFALITGQVIWNGRPAFRRDYYPVNYWLRVWCGAIPAIMMGIFCWRDWLTLLT